MFSIKSVNFRNEQKRTGAMPAVQTSYPRDCAVANSVAGQQQYLSPSMTILEQGPSN